MADSIVFILKVVVILQIFSLSIKGFVLKERNDIVEARDTDSLVMTNIPDHIAHQTAIRQYARHGLCRNFEGKRRMYNAMKVKFCGISLSMIQSLVMDLCRHKNHMLDKWVKELFDIDGNGYISHFEKHYYT